MNRPPRVVLVCLLTTWAVGTLGAFWYFEGRYLRPVARPAGAALAAPGAPPAPAATILDTDRGLVRLGEAGPVTLLNFWNPRCPCSRYAETDVQRLARTCAPRGVRFITLVESGQSSQSQQEALAAWRGRHLAGFACATDPGGQVARALGVWAAPAAVILDAQGRVQYVGAYNAARFCDDPHTAWAWKALDAVLAGRKPPCAKTLFFGCQVAGQAA